MNRSILIVICDFLLVSLLVFSTPDLTRVTGDDEKAAQPAPTALATNAPSGGQDLAAVMRLALNEEQQKREQLAGALEQTRETAARQSAQLTESEKRIQNFQQQLQSREQQAQQLQQEQAALQQQFAAAQTNLETLNAQLLARAAEANASKEQLAAMQADVQQQEEQAAALKKRLAELEKANQSAATEKEKLANQLQLAELEKKHAAEQAVQMQEQVRIEREEKAQLQQQATKMAEGVKVLANKSGELAKEIRENRPLASNTIFNEFLTNRVEAQLAASRSGMFGRDVTRQTVAGTVLVSEGTNMFALCHVQETPLTLWTPGTDWEALTGVLQRGEKGVPVNSLSFCWPDPRVVLIPVTAADAQRLGVKTYQISSEPFKFQDAVLVGAEQSYYGECKFQIDLKMPGYVKLDRSVLKGLFGKFNPSRGDLVFSRTGELLGIMANDTYCMMLRNLNTAATLKLGRDVHAEKTGATLSRLYEFVTDLPLELQ